MQYRNIDKQALKENGYTVLSKITIVGTNTVFTEDDHIVDWTYEDYRYVPDNGFIGQFVERIFDGNLQDISEDVILEDTEINLQLGIVNALDNNATTWYNYGNFLVTKVEKTDTTGNYRFESADYTKKFNKLFDGDYTDTTYTKSFNERLNDEETVTALWLAQYVCKQAGVVLNDTNFTNYNFVISSNQYDSDDTLRKVMQDIGKLAYSWVRVGEDNKVHIDFTPKATSSVDQYDRLTTDEYYVSKKSDLTFGPVNKVLIGMSDVEGENLYVTSPDYTEETECAIKIYDNNLTNTEELRQIALNGASRLFGLTYTPVEINSVGHPWLDGDELIKLTNVDDVELYTYPFNRKLTYSGYIEGTIGAEAQTSQQSKYEYKSDIISNVKKTSIIVDKQEQTITALVNRVEGDESDLSQLQVDVNGIDARVTSVETTQITGVTNEYAVNDSATNPPAESSSSWSETKPTRGEGQYIWARIKTTYKNGNIEYSDPVNTTGDKGDKGEDAAQAVMYHNAKGTEIYTEDAGDLELKSINFIEGEITQETTKGYQLLKNTNVDSGDGNYWQTTTSIFDETARTITITTNQTKETIIGHRINGIKSNQTYTMSAYAKSNGKVTSMDFFCYNSSIQGIKSKTFTNLTTEFQKYTWTFTTASDIDYSTGSTIRVDNNGTIESGVDATLIVKDVMLEEGSTAHDYEDFTNGPSPNPDYPQSINVVSGDNYIDICRKNLFDKDNVEIGKFYISNGTSTSTNWAIAQVKVKPNSNYYLSGNNYNNDSAKIVLLDSSKNIISDLGGYKNVHSITTNSNTSYIGLSIANYENNSDLSTIQLEVGNEATNYELFNGKNYEINLGKNLFNLKIWKDNLSTDFHGATGTIENNTIYIDNSAGVDAYTSTGVITSGNLPSGQRMYAIELKPNTQYTLSFIASFAGSSRLNSCYYSLIDKDYNYITFNNMGYMTPNVKHKVTITTTSDTKYLTFRLGADTAISEITYSEIQLEKGEYTSYSSYFTPIELGKINDYKDFIFKGKGINLANPNNLNLRQTLGATGGLTSNTSRTTLYQIEIEPNTLYSSFLNNDYQIGNLFFYDKNKTYLSQITSAWGNNKTFTSPNNAHYVSFATRKSNDATMVQSDLDNLEIQIEKGNKTTYEPYNAKGKWYLHKEIGKVVLNGSENWILNQETTYVNQYLMSGTNLSEDVASGTSFIMSDYFKYKQDNPSSTTNEDYMWLYRKKLVLDVRKTIVSDASGLKTWVGNNKPPIYYQLATPTTTEITSSNYPELLSQLNELEKLHLFEGINNITINGDLPIILDMDYWTYYKGETGDTGEEGKGIESTTELYYVTNETSTPAQPTSHVTLSSLVGYNAWNLQCPPYTTTYKNFYTCSEILYTDGTYGWTNVTQNQGLAIANQNAYDATQTANTANSTASSASSAAATATTTANNAWNRVNNLKVGSTNILRDTKAFSNTNVINTENGYLRSRGVVTTDETYEDFTVVMRPNTGGVLGEWLVTGCEPGEEYTLSFWVKGDKAPRCYFYGPTGYIQVAKVTTQNGIGYSPDGNSDSQAGGVPYSADKWQRVWVTWKLKDTGGTTSDKYVLIRNDNQGTIYIAGAKLEKGNIATEWSPAPEDVQGQIDQNAADIDDITANFTNYVTTVTYDADWTNRKDEIYSYVSERYTTTSDFGEYQETMQTALSQKADATTISATATQVVNDALSGISETISNVEETFTFSTAGLEIARSGNTMSLLLQNDRMSFMSSGSEKMYMTSNSLVLYDLEQLQLGNYAFVVRANGSIDFKKVQ